MPLRRLACCAIAAYWPLASARVRILVLTVADSGHETRARLLRNMQHVDATHARHRALVHWAICAYDDRLHEWAGLQLRLRSSVRHVRLVALTNGSDALKDKIHATKHSRCCWRKARGALHRVLLRSAWTATGRDAYDAIWMLDADLRMEAFDLPRFLHRWMCSFEGGAPLVAQPLNGANTQVWPFNARTWSKAHCARSNSGSSCLWSQTAAMRIAFIEGQSAIVDARFFSWFLELPLVRHILTQQVIQGVEWGLDGVWCSAAAAWALAANVSRTACAVIAVPIDHDNSRSMAAGTGRHSHHGYRLLTKAGLRHSTIFCKSGEGCLAHPWFRFQPAPAWKAPRTPIEEEQVRLCAVADTIGRRAVCPQDNAPSGAQLAEVPYAGAARAEDAAAQHQIAQRLNALAALSDDWRKCATSEACALGVMRVNESESRSSGALPRRCDGLVRLYWRTMRTR